MCIRDRCKIYNPGENEVRALDHVNLEIKTGEFVAIIGQSGSGKSTFMNMLGCLDVPTSGKYYLNGTDVSTIDVYKRQSPARSRNGVMGSFSLAITFCIKESLPIQFVADVSSSRRKTC